MGPEWIGIAPHAMEGFQVSKRDSGTGEGFSGQRGNYQGDCQGVIKEIVQCALNNVNPVHIVLLCVCCANKRIVFRLWRPASSSRNPCNDMYVNAPILSWGENPPVIIARPGEIYVSQQW
jgi:hypothetical protein